MDTNTFLIRVYCLIDNFLMDQHIRKREPQPIWIDSEVLTMEIIGSFFGIDTDKGLYTFFKCHYGDWFPALLKIHRTTFTRQMANLWKVKEQIWRHVIAHLQFDRQISVIDSFQSRFAGLLEPTVAGV